MESFKKWMDRVVGKRPDITYDFYTPNESAGIDVEDAMYESKEISAYKFHLIIMSLCAQYAERLSSVESTDYSKKKATLERLKLTRSKNYKEILNLERLYSEANTVNYFKSKFSNSIFMRFGDFKNLCVKYGLICGCLQEFKGDVPDKNLEEISSALETIFSIDTYADVINSGYYKVSSISIVEGRNGRKLTDEIHALQEHLNNFHFYKAGDFNIIEECDNFYSHNGIYNTDPFMLDRDDFLIAAPAGLMEKVVYNYQTFKEPKSIFKDDPIVFQILPHDIIMIHSKWGDESNDPMLEERKL